MRNHNVNTSEYDFNELGRQLADEGKALDYYRRLQGISLAGWAKNPMNEDSDAYRIRYTSAAPHEARRSFNWLRYYNVPSILAAGSLIVSCAFAQTVVDQSESPASSSETYYSFTYADGKATETATSALTDGHTSHYVTFMCTTEGLTMQDNPYGRTHWVTAEELQRNSEKPGDTPCADGLDYRDNQVLDRLAVDEFGF